MLRRLNFPASSTRYDTILLRGGLDLVTPLIQLKPGYVRDALNCAVNIQRQLIEEWDVLATMTPSEYAEIRPFLATSSGFQSFQYRAVEFLLGNKNAKMIVVFAHAPQDQAQLRQALQQQVGFFGVGR